MSRLSLRAAGIAATAAMTVASTVASVPAATASSAPPVEPDQNGVTFTTTKVVTLEPGTCGAPTFTVSSPYGDDLSGTLYVGDNSAAEEAYEYDFRGDLTTDFYTGCFGHSGRPGGIDGAELYYHFTNPDGSETDGVLSRSFEFRQTCVLLRQYRHAVRGTRRTWVRYDFGNTAPLRVDRSHGQLHEAYASCTPHDVFHVDYVENRAGRFHVVSRSVVHRPADA